MNAPAQIGFVGGGVLHRKAKPCGCLPPSISRHTLDAGDEWVCLTCHQKWEVFYQRGTDPRGLDADCEGLNWRRAK